MRTPFPQSQNRRASVSLSLNSSANPATIEHDGWRDLDRGAPPMLDLNVGTFTI